MDKTAMGVIARTWAFMSVVATRVVILSVAAMSRATMSSDSMRWL